MRESIAISGTSCEPSTVMLEVSVPCGQGESHRGERHHAILEPQGQRDLVDRHLLGFYRLGAIFHVRIHTPDAFQIQFRVRQ